MESVVGPNSPKVSASYVGKLPFFKKLFYSLGECNQTVTYTIVSMYLLIFLTDVVGINPITAATLIMIAKIWDGINNPIMGSITDRTKSRWGRRRPYILFAGVPAGLLFMMIFSPVTIDSEILKVLFVGGAYFLFVTASSAFAIPYYSLGMELTDDYDERTSIANFRVTIGLVVGLVVILGGGQLLDSAADAKTGYFQMAIALGLISILFPLLVFFNTKERDCFIKNSETSYSFKETVTAFTKNGPLISASIMIFLRNIAFSVQEGFMVYYFTYWMNRADELPLFLITAMISWVLSLPLWQLVVKKTDKRFAYIASCGVWIIASFMYQLIPQNHTGILPFVVQAAIGLGFGYAHVVPPAMVPEIADLDEFKNGKRREGLIWGIWNMFNSFGSAVALMPVTIILTAVGYVPNVVQSDTALTAIRWIMTLGTAVPVSLGIIATLFYSITKKRYSEIRNELERRHIEKESLSSST